MLDIEDVKYQEALVVIVSRCEETIFGFINKIAKYDITVNSSRSSIKAAIRKIQWAVYSEKDLCSFHAELQAHLATLSITLQQILMASTSCHANKTNAALVRIQIQASHAQVVQIIILQALSRCWSEFRGLTMILLYTNLRILNYFLSDTRLPSQIQERRLLLEDSHGRRLEFPQAWVNDWEDFESLLRIQFKKVPGLRKVQTKEYSLQDLGRRKEINQTMPIDVMFLTGKRIVMSMVFSRQRLSNHLASACPRCEEQGNETKDAYVQCSSCKIWYQIMEKLAPPRQEMPFNPFLLSEDIVDFQRVDILESFTFAPPPLRCHSCNRTDTPE